jgi:hypothetical protein
VLADVLVERLWRLTPNPRDDIGFTAENPVLVIGPPHHLSYRCIRIKGNHQIARFRL